MAHRKIGALALAAAVALAGCGGDGTGSETGRAPARMDVVAGDLQTAPVGTELAQPLVVKVLDAKGKPASGQVVNFRVTAGGGSVFAGAAQTNADGEARERWTLGPVAGDTQRVEVRAVDASTGAAQVFATFRAVGTAGSAASVAIVNDSARVGAAGDPLGNPVAVLVRDAGGNPVPGATVSWTVLVGGGTVSAATTATNAQGVASVQWTLGPQVGSPQSIRATVAGVAPVTAQATANRVQATATVTPSGSGQSGNAGSTLPTPLAVVVKLADGRPVLGDPVAWTTASGSIVPSAVGTDGTGLAQVFWTLGTTAGTQTATATVAGLAPVSFTATAQGSSTVASITFVNPEVSAPAGSTITVTVELRDQYGNPVPGAPVAWSIYARPVIRTSDITPVAGTEAWWTPIGNGSVAPTSGVSDAAGRASVQLTLGTIIGKNGVQVSAGGRTAFNDRYTGTGAVTTPISCTAAAGGFSAQTMTGWTVSCFGTFGPVRPATITIYIADRTASLGTSASSSIFVSSTGLDAGRFYPVKVLAVFSDGTRAAVYSDAWYPPFQGAIRSR